jgi:hypothetical protein
MERRRGRPRTRLDATLRSGMQTGEQAATQGHLPERARAPPWTNHPGLKGVRLGPREETSGARESSRRVWLASAGEESGGSVRGPRSRTGRKALRGEPRGRWGLKEASKGRGAARRALRGEGSQTLGTKAPGGQGKGPPGAAREGGGEEGPLDPDMPMGRGPHARNSAKGVRWCRHGLLVAGWRDGGARLRGGSQSAHEGSWGIWKRVTHGARRGRPRGRRKRDGEGGGRKP